MRKFSWSWRHISKSNSEKTFAEILLKEWSLFLPIFDYEKEYFIGKIESSSARTEVWKMVESGGSCGQLSQGGYQYWCVHFAGKKQRRPLDTVDLEQLPDSRERTGAPVLWLSCENQVDVWELFSHNSSLSAILDRQRLLVAAPVDLSLSPHL